MGTDTDSLLAFTANRSYPLPDRPWKYSQRWENVLFLHWQVPQEVVEKLLPPGLAVDTFDGTCWISLVSFSVNPARMKHLPALPYFSNFNEVNLRVYVVKDHIPGIYMLSIETNKLPVALLCRIFLGLPYEHSHVNVNARRLLAENERKGYRAQVRFKMKEAITAKSALDLWLTERHCLYQEHGKKLYRFDIHHKEWELQHAKAHISRLQYHQDGFNTVGKAPDLIHGCQAIDVLLWSPVQV